MSSGTYTPSSLCTSMGTPSPLFHILIVLASCHGEQLVKKCI